MVTPPEPEDADCPAPVRLIHASIVICETPRLEAGPILTASPTPSRSQADPGAGHSPPPGSGATYVIVSLGRYDAVACSLEATSMPLVFVACVMMTPAFAPPSTHDWTIAMPLALRVIVLLPVVPVTVPTT